jgi:hypothetical protein
VTVVQREYRFEVASMLPEGRVVIDLQNMGTLPHQLALVRLPPDVPPLAQQLRGGERRAISNIALMLRPPGSTRTFALDLTRGRYGMLCFLPAADGESHALKGMIAEFEVG